MFWMKKKRKSGQVGMDAEAGAEIAPVVVTVTLTDIKKLIREFEEQLPKGINRTILIGQDNEINFQLLIPYLQGVPDRRFYMSRESFEVFDEEERHIPQWLDVVQRAVDDYMTEVKAAPVVPGDRRRKISYALLEKSYYLKERPPIDFYLTNQQDLITHVPIDR